MYKISVIGAGTMGNGIAHVFAQYGFPVNLVDRHSDQLEKALSTISKNLERQVQKGTISSDEKTRAFDRIRTFQTINDGVSEADLVVEAATENENIKIQIFQELDKYAPPAAILATNTSSISITRISAVTKRPAQVIGMHFMNPVPLMKLVEVINGYATDAGVTKKIVDLSKKLGKIPCVVNDYPGFISNRILMPMINEAIISLQEGVASVDTIDSIMKLGMSHPMGPLQLADFIGLDVCLAILIVLRDGFGNPKYSPATLLINMVAAGRLGIKSGEGFYDYRNGQKELLVSERLRQERGS
jgi:3-hydroxybutyryl-CoA dehydrogenase